MVTKYTGKYGDKIMYHILGGQFCSGSRNSAIPFDSLHRHCESHSKFDFILFQCIKTLLDNGCSPDITDNNGLTAAELGKKCFHNSCADLIQSYISQVKKKNFS